MAKLNVDLLTGRKDIWYIADILRGFDIMDGYTTMSFNEFHVPNHSVFGGKSPDIGWLASSFWK